RPPAPRGNLDYDCRVDHHTCPGAMRTDLARFGQHGQRQTATDDPVDTDVVIVTRHLTNASDEQGLSAEVEGGSRGPRCASVDCRPKLLPLFLCPYHANVGGVENCAVNCRAQLHFWKSDQRKRYLDAITRRRTAGRGGDECHRRDASTGWSH